MRQSILEEDKKGEALRGLLVSLLTLFDTNNNQSLTQDEYMAAAEALGYDTSSTAWDDLCARYGDQTTKQGRPVAEVRELARNRVFGDQKSPKIFEKNLTKKLTSKNEMSGIV